MVRPTPEQVDEAINRRLAFLDFWEFCLYYDYDFFTRRPFLQQVADGYQWLYSEYVEGRSKRVSVSLPPRSGKSYITSLFCAWWIGKLPKLCVMRNSCTATLYKKLSRHVRNMIEDPRYRAVFPDITLSSDNTALENWSVKTARNGSYFGGGVDTNIIGNGADLSINDDLYPGITQALSPGYNEKVVEWKEGTADSRKESGCPELYIGTRWRKGDVIGKAIDDGKIDLEIKVAALDENDKSFCEDVRTTAEYHETRRDIDPGIWEAEYMQSPIDLKGSLFPKSALNFYDPSKIDVDKLSEYSMCSIDPAGRGDDDLAAPNGRLIGNRVYIHDVIFNKFGTEYNEPHCVEFIKKNKCESVEFEGNAAWDMMGIAIRNKLADDGSDCDLTVYHSTSNKNVRILAMAAWIKNHMWFRSDYEGIPEYKRFMKGLFDYMTMGTGATNQHDDAPDSLAVVAKFFKLNFPDLWKVITREDSEQENEE